jgi:hypothetical protein
MQLRIRQIGVDSALSDVKRLEALERAVPRDMVETVLLQHHAHEQRCRKLSMCQVVYLVIAMNLFAKERLALVLERLWHTWHWLFASETDHTPKDAAIHYRRDQLGVAPLVDLFHRVCVGLATPKTRGAYLFGLLKMVMDSKTFNLSDAPGLAGYFGRPKTKRGPGAFPQARLVTLEEVGTHATVDAGVWPLRIHERKGAKRLLRSVRAGMLVFLDCGLYSAEMMLALLNRGAQVLARLPAHVKPRLVRRLADGTWLVWVSVKGSGRHPKRTGVLLRLIAYTFSDPANPGHAKTYRLVTTLLDPSAYPAQELAVGYHERWDVEETYDEMEVHLLKGSAPLRSQTVLGVLQEIYGLLVAHYAVRALMHEAALRADIDPDTISFTATVHLVQEAIPDFQLAAPCLHEILFERLLGEIARQRVQKRPPRSNPRVVKRKMSNFPLKRATDRGSQRCLPYQRAIHLI